MYITKRDGRKELFDKEKLKNAITRAFVSSQEKCDDIDAIVNAIIITNNTGVEKIQDKVEAELMKNYPATAKAYILYRNKRTEIREGGRELDQTLWEIVSGEKPDVTKENANINGDTPMGTILRFGSEASKKVGLKRMMSSDATEAHRNGDIHIHDLDFLAAGATTTCMQIDITKLFENGFNTGHGRLREPQSIMSYASLAAIAIQANQNDQHGGQSIPAFDYDMAIGVRKSYSKIFKEKLIDILEDVLDVEFTTDDFVGFYKENGEPKYHLSLDNIYYQKLKDYTLIVTQDKEIIITGFDRIWNKVLKALIKRSNKEIEKQTHQAMEGFIHNVNTLNSRAGSQVPFSSINYGTDTSEEGRLVMKMLLQATDEGLGNGETPIFPIQVFKVKNGINAFEGDPNYDLFERACYVSAKRLFPNFEFLDAPYNLKYYNPNDYHSEVATMGCRTRVYENRYNPDNITSFGRGNLSFTTINLPRLGIENGRINENGIDEFFKKLDEMMVLCKEQLLDRLQIQMKKKVKNFPFLMGQGIWVGSDKLNKEDELGDILKEGSLSIGFIGLAECLIALTGKHHGESIDAQKLGLDIVKHMRQMTDKFAEETGLNFSLFATPAEGLSFRFTDMDKKKYGIIKGITDKDYYTNSFHVPVYYDISLFEKIDIEAPYHALCNAGHITYVEVEGDLCKNPKAFETIVHYMMQKGIGYGAINHPVDRCTNCNYTGTIIGDTCPACDKTEGNGTHIERIRRITGYLVGDMNRWNRGKKAEEKDRVKHDFSYRF